MKEDILPNACSVDTDLFRERLAGDPVADMFVLNRRNLKNVFDIYAADDDSDEAVGFLNTMNRKELTTLCSEFKLLGPIVTQRAIRTIFAYVQQEEELMDDDDGADDDDIGCLNQIIH